MKTKNTLFTIATASLFVFASCGQNADKTSESDKTETNETTKSESASSEPESKSQLGNFETLVGNWTVDAATAGLQMDISFTDDGQFHQKMGESHNQSGTWEIVDDQHIKIVTPSTEGQTWLVTDLNDESVNICWNPDSEKPKTIPFQRAE